MDFFTRQETARKHTKLLICYFVLAVLGLTVSLYGVAVTAEHFMAGKSRSRSSTRTVTGARQFGWWNPLLFLWSSVGTLGVVFLGSAYKTMQLSGGGATIAKELGGRLVNRDTQQTDERRLLNVVEEMALAAGMPVPDVYLMDEEDSINAFAAGHTPGDAIIGVSRGAMRQLTRDELQGVMAHEFSHILNGDMRLNLRLIGWVHGILVIALLGQILLRLTAHSGGGRNEKEGGGRIALLAIGAAIMAIGYLGVFFANLIKAAISRQREFLADASAVQFTRNPDGIGGALQKIGASAGKSYLATAGVETAGHMLFGEGKAHSLFDSHPSLEERIRRVLPAWDGKFPNPQSRSNKLRYQTEEAAAANPSPQEGLSDSFRMAAMAAASQISQEPRALGADVSVEDLHRARAIQSALPTEWRQLLCDPISAQAMMFALLLSEDSNLLSAEEATLREALDDELVTLTLRLHEEVQQRPSAQLIAVIDLAIPALRRLTLEEYHRFTKILVDLMASDQKIDIFEFMVQKILRRHLDLHFRQVPPPQVCFVRFEQLLAEAQIIIATLANADTPTPDEARRAYASARSYLADLPPTLLLRTDLPSLNQALDRFEQAAPMMKRQLLHACGLVVLADRKVHNEEAELLRAIADTIGCPMPPLVA